MTVGDLLDRISSEELTEWAAYYPLDPFDSFRDDYRTGMVCSTLANIHAAKGKKYIPQDFMPKFGVKGDLTPAMTPEQILDRFQRAARGG